MLIDCKLGSEEKEFSKVGILKLESEVLSVFTILKFVFQNNGFYLQSLCILFYAFKNIILRRGP